MLHLADDGDFVAILQITADARQIDAPHLPVRVSQRLAVRAFEHARRIAGKLLQLGGITDARQHQELRRIERTAAQDDFAFRLDQDASGRSRGLAVVRMRLVQPFAVQVLDADGARRLGVVEDDVGDERIRPDLQVFRMGRARFEQQFARARTPAAHHERRLVVLMNGRPRTADGQRHGDHALGVLSLRSSMIRIELFERAAAQEGRHPGPGAIEARFPRLPERRLEHVDQLPIGQADARCRSRSCAATP